VARTTGADRPLNAPFQTGRSADQDCSHPRRPAGIFARQSL